MCLIAFLSWWSDDSRPHRGHTGAFSLVLCRLLSSYRKSRSRGLGPDSSTFHHIAKCPRLAFFHLRQTVNNNLSIYYLHGTNWDLKGRRKQAGQAQALRGQLGKQEAICRKRLRTCPHVLSQIVDLSLRIWHDRYQIEYDSGEVIKNARHNKAAR